VSILTYLLTVIPTYTHIHTFTYINKQPLQLQNLTLELTRHAVEFIHDHAKVFCLTRCPTVYITLHILHHLPSISLAFIESDFGFVFLSLWHMIACIYLKGCNSVFLLDGVRARAYSALFLRVLCRYDEGLFKYTNIHTLARTYVHIHVHMHTTRSFARWTFRRQRTRDGLECWANPTSVKGHRRRQ